jgi:sugar lactone lactonase YvrE
MAMAWSLAACMGGGGNDAAPASIGVAPPAESQSRVELLAGGLGGSGYVDGPASRARLCYPGAMTEGADGTLYFLDCNAVRALSPNGELRTIAGSRLDEVGWVDGEGMQARFSNPLGIAVDADAGVLVADYGNAAIRRIAPGGRVTTVAGQPGNTLPSDGAAGDARFRGPQSLAIDAGGSLLIGDGSALRRLSREGRVDTVAGSMEGESGISDGPALQARFGGLICALAYDANGALVLTDTFSGTLRRLANGQVTTLAPPPALQLPGSTNFGASAWLCGAAFDVAGGLHVAGGALLKRRNGDLLAADGNNAVLSRVATDGSIVAVLGQPAQVGAADGVAGAARFQSPAGLAVDPDGNVFVADFWNHSIRKVSPAGLVTTVAGSAAESALVDGPAAVARFEAPNAVAIDAARNLYVTDQMSSVVRKITPQGVVSTLAGSRAVQGGADGTGAAASFFQPRAPAVDAAGSVLVLQGGAVRRISPQGVVTTWVGRFDAQGSADGIGTAARFTVPGGMAVDAAGNVFVADSGNHSIRKITPAGVVTTFAGSPGVPGHLDGRGAAARFRWPTLMTFDADGTLYVADTDNSVVRRITPQGEVSTVAGVGSTRAVALGERGLLNRPFGLGVLPGLPRRLVRSDENAVLVVTPR